MGTLQASQSPNLVVTDVVRTNIKPAEKSPHPEIIDLTIQDDFVKDTFMPTFSAYRLASKSDEAYLQWSNQIKEGLRKVLVPFFPFAGKCIPVLEGSGRQLLCNDEGVPFVEAYVDKDMDSVLRASNESQPLLELHGYDVVFGEGTRPTTIKMRPNGLPAIFVQMTRFKCGGVVLAVTFNHMVCDGEGFYDFMTAWSDLSQSKETTIKPNPNRILAKRVGELLPAANQSLLDKVHYDLPPIEKLKKLTIFKNFQVSKSAIDSLKLKVKESNKGSYISTGDCITAHIWRSLAKLPSSILGEKEVRMGIVVEGRERFYDPPLRHLCGNVWATMTYPKTPATTLLERPLHSTALKCREKLLATSRETWFSEARIAEEMDALASNKYASWMISSWFKFPLYNVDFGGGNPIFASGTNFLAIPFNLGCIFILPPIPSCLSSAATVKIFSSPQVLQALESDPEYVNFFVQNWTM